MVIRNCHQMIGELSEIESKIKKLEKVLDHVAQELSKEELLKKILQDFAKTTA